ncbi:SDR family oxidoreductase [Pseudomonas sp. MYb185]|uniref:SDR family oxidoreductase n=1 Tax=Pseudomonas sp. MYb185 TaxID=1848729 RepID=UPI000CFDDB7B|nr:SDR family oxidoreductase [Pseudomonas sp. MYb185]PRB77466.1 3-oxoacyl-ACP reductase [Pseudomonas sp. MYb185]
MTVSNVYEELFSLSGKTALVTGGAKGIGAMISRMLLRAGCKVFVTGRSRSAAEQLTTELGPDAAALTFLQHDLSQPEGIDALAAELDELCPQLNILVNNAGTFNAAPLGDTDSTSWNELMGLNLRAPFLLVQALLPLLEAAGSNADPARIINLGSIGGLMPQSNGGAYAYGCSKAAVHQLTRMLASDLRSRNINVNAIAPGYFPSDMTSGFFEAVPNLRENMLAQIPAGRFGSAEDVGGMVIFLASRAGAYLTGSITALDGGLLSAP